MSEVSHSVMVRLRLSVEKTFCGGSVVLLSDSCYLCTKPSKPLSMNSEIINKIREYFSGQPVEKAWLFGSMSRGEDTPDSDVDILVQFDPDAEVDLFDHAGMMLDLQDILKRAVDIVTAGTLFPWVRESVDNDKILIYERKIA